MRISKLCAVMQALVFQSLLIHCLHQTTLAIGKRSLMKANESVGFLFWHQLFSAAKMFAAAIICSSRSYFYEWPWKRQGFDFCSLKCVYLKISEVRKSIRAHLVGLSSLTQRLEKPWEEHQVRWTVCPFEPLLITYDSLLRFTRERPLRAKKVKQGEVG